MSTNQNTALIAVTFALPDESKDFVAALRNVRTLAGGSLPVITGDLDGKPVAICHTGVGPDSCRARITAFLNDHSPALLISSGFAGGLDPALKVGDVIIAANFSDPSLAAKLDGTNAITASMTSQPSVAETVEGKAALFTQTGSRAVDMETATIRGFCTTRSIPMLSLRGISDSATDELPVAFPIWFDSAKQTPRVGALLWHLATHPAKIPAFARFVSGITSTRKSLTTALIAAVRSL